MQRRGAASSRQVLSHRLFQVRAMQRQPRSRRIFCSRRILLLYKGLS
ncbi:Protein of unknown function [Cotesia congregata]|uniref:Uncharacterized protein n=1 Tax=Cotesia congregata TaxID=51543 RepID=A0A8J2EI61_COTCN|nr:Protein of unknown function [Cotesia congregata]